MGLNFPNICSFLLTFSIFQYLIGFIILSNNVGIHFVFTYYFLIHPFRLVPGLVVVHLEMKM
jgi:hypothetical protein